MASNQPTTTAQRPRTPLPKKLRRLFHVLFFMLRKVVSKHRPPFLDLHLLLKRGKLASKKAFSNLLSHHHHNHHDKHVHYPSEAEFSCSSTPSPKHRELYLMEPEAIAKALEVVNLELGEYPCEDSEEWAVGSPWWGLQSSPEVAAWQLRITDSSFPMAGEEEEEGKVDEEAEKFIKNFYEQLRLHRWSDDTR